MILIASAIGCSSPSRAPVDASEEPPVDAEETVIGEFAAACSKHTDCETGYCVEPIGDTGGVCTRQCSNDDCPEGWECRTVDLPQVDLQLCVPAAQQLCLACATDEECGGGVCLTIDGGGRCATPCTDTCAVGYTCAPDATGTNTGNFCQPVTGSCECSAAMAGAMRSCSNDNAVGTCFGTQTCSATTGWSACTARVPADETCNGVDDDCNFVIDDGVGGGENCTNTNGFGTCAGLRACDGTAGDFVCIGPMPKAEACNSTDDDCDTMVDEAYIPMGLGQACTAGVGACQRYGSQRCNSSQNGVVCSAVAGNPVTETCNQINDDCDGATDETFKTPMLTVNPLGSVCSAGLGVCTRYGTNVCAANGSGTTCSATPNMGVATTETCNYADDNCDGNVDNGFRDANGVYNTVANCGSCGTDCATVFTGQFAVGLCQAGPTSAVCAMGCQPGHGNLNGSTFDGCEFTLDATAIYVSTTDATAIDDATCGLGPTGTGTGNHPCKTITQGLLRSTQTSRANVLVADGTYAEAITLISGKNVLGGYRADTWERHLSTTATVISGASAANNHDRTVIANAITAATVFEGFVVRGSFNSKPGGNSYAVYVSGSTTSLVIRNNQIFAGRGGAGAVGNPGPTGSQGVNGGGSTGPMDNNYSGRTVNNCAGNATFAVVRQLSNGGLRTCGGVNVSGGNGGGNWCPPSANAGLPGNQSAERSAIDGFGGLTNGTAGTRADAGDDGFISNNGLLCTIPSTVTFGIDGTSGPTGTSAGGVAGCTNTAGTITGGHWVANAGTTGGSGTNGGGGGGGGAGGGGYCQDCVNGAPTGGNHRIGGHGGGGGSGGCGGAGGAGGGGGGGAFAIFVVGSAGQTPTIQNNAITRGNGGNGGNGGIGGAGGLGGQGGQGGLTDQHCTDKGGRGGDGGAAGHGAGGGGGCGGSSFGIYTSGIGNPNYCAASNSVTGGSAGGGGSGGFSGGNSGGAGTAGVLQDCVSL